ncbi:MAG: hypothetical protein U1F22_12295 [Lysobacterales bacterium]
MFQPRFFVLRRPRHRLLRVLGTLLGLALLAGLLAFGVVALLVLAAIGGVVWLVRQLRASPLAATAAGAQTRPAPPSGVIEGEFVVLRDGPRLR